MLRSGSRLAVVVFAALVVAVPGASLARPESDPVVRLPGLEKPARVLRDGFGVPHVYAAADRDAWFLNGYLHAQDRFFQMDLQRRRASGTLAELLGAGPGDSVLGGDVTLRTLGLRRAAERSLAAYPPSVRAVLDAYANGVNLALSRDPLPPEYAALGIAAVPTWTPLDSVAIAKLLAFGLSFDDGDLRNTQLLLAYSTAGAALGFDGGALLADVVPNAPFDPTVAIRPGEQSGPTITRPGRSRGAPAVREDAVAAAAELLARAEGLPRDWNAAGSNWWVVSGQHSSSGSPLLASDPHLSLSSPPVFHELHLDVSGGPADRLNVYGATFPGVPGVVLGFNERIMWGATVNPLDVTDFFQEQLVISGGVPVAAVHEGVPKPLEIIPEQFRVSEAGTVVPVPPGTRPGGLVVPPATFVLPWRSDGPLVSVAGTTGISVQYTGFGPTRELETFLRWNRGRNLADFREGLRFFDVGSQNWGYADVDGNIAYFTSAEMPLRADLQAGTVVGLPPWFVRSGAGPNDWIPQPDPPADQATPFQILPAEEMPHLVNPERGWIANANNDPIGTSLDNDPINQLRPGGGIYYLSPGYAIGNRAGRVETLIEEALAGGGTLSPADMARIQADVIMRDAEVLAPHVVAAFQAASTPGAPPPLAALAADPGVGEGEGGGSL
jgi:penicillin G amidase